MSTSTQSKLTSYMRVALSSDAQPTVLRRPTRWEFVACACSKSCFDKMSQDSSSSATAQCCHPPPIPFHLPPARHAECLGRFGWWVPLEEWTSVPDVPDFWKVAHHFPELVNVEEMASSSEWLSPARIGRHIFYQSVGLYAAAQNMIDDMFDETPGAYAKAASGRASTQFTALLITLEQISRSQVAASRDTAAGANTGPSPDVSEEDIVPETWWPNIDKWMKTPSGPRPLVTCFCTNELVIENLQPSRPDREESIRLTCGHLVGAQCQATWLRSLRGDRERRNQPPKCIYCGVRISDATLHVLATRLQ